MSKVTYLYKYKTKIIQTTNVDRSLSPLSIWTLQFSSVPLDLTVILKSFLCNFDFMFELIVSLENKPSQVADFLQTASGFPSGFPCVLLHSFCPHKPSKACCREALRSVWWPKSSTVLLTSESSTCFLANCSTDVVSFFIIVAFSLHPTNCCCLHSRSNPSLRSLEPPQSCQMSLGGLPHSSTSCIVRQFLSTARPG